MSEFDEVELLDRIHDLTWREFETFVASLWELQGWTTELTEERGDNGRDIIAERNLPYDVTIKIETKRWSEGNNISSPDIRQYALLPGDDIDHAVIVTSSSFTDPAKRTASRHNVKLINSSQLVRLIQSLGAEDLLNDDYSVDDWERVKSAKYIDWVVNHIEEEDLIDVLPGIGPIRGQRLAKAGVHTLGDLLSADLAILNENTDFPESTLQRWINLATFHKGGERPDVIEGIDQATVTKLAEADVYTVDDLQSACPKKIADKTDFHEETLKIWVGDAVRRDDTRVTEIPKIGTERGKRLAEIGIHTISDLIESDPDDVAKQTNLGRRFLQERIEHTRTNHS